MVCGLGAAQAASAQVTWRSTGEDVNNNFGYSVAEAGDVDHDAFPDLIIGAWHVNHPTNSADIQIGGAYVYSGRTRGLLWKWTGENYKDHFGNSVSGAGDVDGDGYADLVVASRMYQAGGQINAGAMSYAVDGRQYIAIAAGSALFTFALPED